MLRIALCVVLSVSLFSCGGGDGDDENPNNALFAGPYFVCSIQGLLTTVADVDSNFGTGNADAEGTFTGSTMQNDDGAVTGPFDFELPYFLDQDRVAAFNGGVWQGAFTQDGSIAAMSTIVDNSIPQLQMIVRSSGASSASTLTGDYQYGYWRREGTNHVCTVGTMTFDGTDSWTATVRHENSDGLVTSGGQLMGTYTVAADGTTDITFDGSLNTLRGGVREGGLAAFLGGTVGPGGFPAQLILIRAANNANDTTLVGEYYVAGFGSLNNGGYESTIGLLSADAGTNVSLTFTSNSNGGVIPQAQIIGTSTVAADGELGLNLGPSFSGGIAPAGDIAFLGGGTNQTSGPVLLFLIRR